VEDFRHRPPFHVSDYRRSLDRLSIFQYDARREVWRLDLKQSCSGFVLFDRHIHLPDEPVVEQLTQFHRAKYDCDWNGCGHERDQSGYE